MPLKRSWCLVRQRRLHPSALLAALSRVVLQWEIFCSVETGAQLDVALSHEETASFHDTLVRHLFKIARRDLADTASRHASSCTGSMTSLF